MELTVLWLISRLLWGLQLQGSFHPKVTMITTAGWKWLPLGLESFNQTFIKVDESKRSCSSVVDVALLADSFSDRTLRKFLEELDTDHLFVQMNFPFPSEVYLRSKYSPARRSKIEQTGHTGPREPNNSVLEYWTVLGTLLIRWMPDVVLFWKDIRSCYRAARSHEVRKNSSFRFGRVSLLN